MVNKNRIIFDKEQIDRCYIEFDFEENETIEYAYYDKKEKQLHIVYHNKQYRADYMPNMESKEDKKRLDFIIYGLLY